MSQFASPTRHERITPYDTPAVLVEQLLDGEMTARGVQKTLFDNYGLSPEEREGVRARLKQQAGGNRVAGAVIDTVLNPWVWLMLATTPVGARAIGKGAGVFKPGTKVLAEYATRNAPFLSQIGALSMAQVFHWGPAVDALRAVGENTTKKILELEPVEDAVKEWMSRVGVKTLDSKVLDPVAGERFERAKQLLNASLTGADRDITWKVVTGIKDGVPQIKEWTAKKLLKEGTDLEGMIAAEGLTEVRDQMRRFYRQRFDDLFTEGGKISGDKVLRQWRGLRNSVTNSGEGGGEVIRQLLGDEVQSLVSTGKLTKDGFKTLVEDVFSQGIRHDAYVPRNVWERVAPTKQTKRNLMDLAASPSSVLRVQGRPVTHVQDMDAFARVFGDRVTPEFARMATEQAEAMAKGLDGEGVSRVLRIDPFESIRRYNNDTARTYAMHVVDAAADGELAVGQREWKNMQRADPAARLTDSDIPVGTVFAEASEKPAGGFSYADALLDVGASLPETHHARKVLTEVAIPAVQGRHGVRHLASTAAYLETRQQLMGLAESPIGRAIEQYGGKWGKGVVKGWRDESYLDAAVASQQTRAKMSTLAKWLYTTHLGFNLASSTLNLTQPMALAATWVGAGNTLRGYAEGFAGLGKYLEKRFSQYGVKPITQRQREQLLREAIPDAEFLGLAGPQIEQLDKVSFERARSFGAESKTEKFLNYAMGMFSNTEVVNKLTTMGAVKSAYRQAGRVGEIGGPEFRRTVWNLSNETQFGAHPLNTPLAFMGESTPAGRLLANPLTRMFLTYPTRMAVGAGYVSRYVGGREGAYRDALKDFVRGMGISAVMFETGKNLAGVDLERAGYLAGVSDLVPGFRGGRFDEREGPIPVPPVVDIPYSVVKALATDDRAMLGNAVARLLPGGVAVSKALSAAPEARWVPLGLQRTYAAWGQRQPDGTVPVYKGDGTLLGYKQPAEIIFRAAGVPLGDDQAEQDRVKYLSGQIDEIRKYKRDYTAAMMEGRQRDAQAIAGEYQRRFKVPLLITRQHVEAAKRVRSQPRVDRMMKSIPPELRPQYQAPPVPGSRPVSQIDEAAKQRAVEALDQLQGGSSGFANYEGF